MATITGQKLTELSRLSLASTGSHFYVVSAGGNSFRMYESDLYNTLDKLHISGNYQPKLEDWRFVHRTGNESITGVKNFFGSMSITPSVGAGFFRINDPVTASPVIYYTSLGAFLLRANDDTDSIDINNKTLYNTSGEIVTNWNLWSLQDSGITTLDWKNRRLSGIWNAQGLTISGNPIITGTSTASFVTTGQTGQFATVVNLQSTGSTLNSRINTLSGNIQTTGQVNYNFISSLSGNVITTGQTLDNKINSLSGYFGNTIRSFSTSKINFKTPATYSIFAVPNNYIFLVDTLEVITTDLVSANAAPYVTFGASFNSGFYISGRQVTGSNTLYFRHIFDDPQNAITGNTILTASIATGSTATSHSGILLYKGFVVPSSF